MTEPAYKIEQNIPIPTGGYCKTMGLQSTLEKMGIGESFLMPGLKNRGTPAVIAKRLGMKISTSVSKDGLRVWRIK